MTPAETSLRMEHLRDREVEEWRRTRWLGYVVLAPHRKRGSTAKPEDLMALPGDTEQQSGQVTKEQAEAIREDMRKRLERKKAKPKPLSPTELTQLLTGQKQQP